MSTRWLHHSDKSIERVSQKPEDESDGIGVLRSVVPVQLVEPARITLRGEAIGWVIDRPAGRVAYRTARRGHEACPVSTTTGAIFLLHCKKGKVVVIFGLYRKRRLLFLFVQRFPKLATAATGVTWLHSLVTKVPGNPIPVKEEGYDDDAVVKRHHQETEKNEYGEEPVHSNH